METRTLKVVVSLGGQTPDYQDCIEVEVTGKETKEELEKIAAKEAWEFACNFFEFWGEWIDGENDA